MVDIYGRQVYGIGHGVVEVGYEYERCGAIQASCTPELAYLFFYFTFFLLKFERKAIRMTANIPSNGLIDSGGWDIDIHHRMEPINRVLYLGNGAKFHLGLERGLEIETRRLEIMPDNSSDNSSSHKATTNDHIIKSLDLETLVAVEHDGLNTLYVGTQKSIYRIKEDAGGKVRQKSCFPRKMARVWVLSIGAGGAGSTYLAPSARGSVKFAYTGWWKM